MASEDRPNAVTPPGGTASAPDAPPAPELHAPGGTASAPDAPPAPAPPAPAPHAPPPHAPAPGGTASPRGGRPAQWRLLVMVVLAVLVALGAVLIAGLVATPRGSGDTAGGAAEAGRATSPDTPPLLRDAGDPRPLPDTTLPPLGDLGPAGGLDLSELRGAPAVINFWASWCAPCVEEMPALQAVADDLGITVVGVDYVDQADKAAELARELGITYPLVRDDDGEFGREVGLMGTPTTLFVDAGGMVVRQVAAEMSEEELREIIARELR